MRSAFRRRACISRRSCPEAPRRHRQHVAPHRQIADHPLLETLESLDPISDAVPGPADDPLAGDLRGLVVVILEDVHAEQRNAFLDRALDLPARAVRVLDVLTEERDYAVAAL